jgi:hypothetical protein
VAAGVRTLSAVFGGTVNEVTVDTPFALLGSPTCTYIQITMECAITVTASWL